MSKETTRMILSEEEVFQIFELMGLSTEAQRDSFLFKQLIDEQPVLIVDGCYDLQDITELPELDQPGESTDAKLE